MPSFLDGNDSLGFGPRRRRRISLSPPSFSRPRPDETAPPDDLAGAWPDQQQIEDAKEEYANRSEMPLWARLLNAPSQLLGSEAIKRGIKTGVEQGDVISGLGAAAEGYWDALSHGFGVMEGMQRTDFADIRKAFGGQDTDDGVDNFFINLVGEVILDPVSYLNPLGFVTKAHNAATVARAGMTLQKQVEAGIRGGLVFRIPILQKTGYDVMEGLAKLPLPYFDNFKSLSVQYAKGMDRLYGVLRTSPLIGPILQKFGAVPVRDPETAAAWKAAFIKSGEDADYRYKPFLDRLAKLDDKLKIAVSQDDDIGKTITDLIEIGAKKIDNDGLIADYMKRAPQIMRNNAFRAAYRMDETLRKLWKQAVGVLDENEDNLFAAAAGTADDFTARRVSAIRDLHDKYDFYLPKRWLEEAGLPPRPGIDVDETADTAAGLVGDVMSAVPGAAPTAMESARAAQTAASRAAGEIGQKAKFRAEQEAARMARWLKLKDKIADGTITKEGLEEYLAVHVDAMQTVALSERASKVLSGGLEPYFPRITNPAIKTLLNRQFERMGKVFAFDGKYQFQHTRALTDMTTTEASAYLMEIGSKATGFVGVNKSIDEFKKELAEHGHWAVLKVLFPKKFVSKLARVDEELASFFLSNPIEADYFRLKHGQQAFRRNRLYQYAFGKGSPMIMDEVRFGDPRQVMDLVGVARSKGWALHLAKDGDLLPQMVDEGDIITETVGKDIRSRLNVQGKHVNDYIESMLGDKTTLFDDRMDELYQARQLGLKSDLSYTDKTPYPIASLKREIKSKLDARDALKAARAKLSTLQGSAKAQRGAIQRDIDSLLRIIDDDKARLASLKEGGVNWDEVDKFNREVSERVESIIEAQSGIAKLKTAKRGISAPTDELARLQEDVVNAASTLNRANANEFAIRQAINQGYENMRTARRTTLAGKELSVRASQDEIRAAFKNASTRITPEMISNEAKLIYRLEKDGILGWDELSIEAQEKIMKSGRGNMRLVAMQPEALQAVQQFHRNFTTPDPLKANPIIRLLDGMRSWFVGNTVLHPAMVKTRMTDVLSGMMVAGQGGYATAGAMAMTAKVKTAMAKAAMSGGDVEAALRAIPFNAPWGPTTAYDFLQAGQRGGLLGEHLIQDSLLDVMKETAHAAPRGTGKQIMDWTLGILGMKGTTNNPVLRIGKKFARWGDETVRLQTMFAAAENGVSTMDDVVATAKHWTYGSGSDITSFERYFMRRFIPFFGFSRWASERMVELWANKPGTLSWLAHVEDNANRALGINEANMQTIMPRFVNDALGIPVAMTPEGPKMYMFGNALPLGNIFDMVNAATKLANGEGGEGLQYIGKQMHPAAKTMLELVVNRDFYTGREMEMYPGETDEFLGVQMPRWTRHVLRSWFRGMADLDRLNVFNAQEMKVAVNAVRRGDFVGSRAELPLIERYLTSAFGPVPSRGYQIDVEEDLRHAHRRQQAELYKAKGLLRKAMAEGKTADIEPLQKVIANEIAEIEARQSLAKQFAIDEAASRKKIRLVR